MPIRALDCGKSSNCNAANRPCIPSLIPEIQKIDSTPLPTGNSFVNRITDFELNFYLLRFLMFQGINFVGGAGTEFKLYQV